jgi:ADP-heptose:LPS heptosyltransferase
MKILVVRFSSIGDIVLTSPVLRCLNKQLGATVHVLTRAVFRDVLEPNPYVDRVYATPRGLREVLPDLKKERYDHVVDLHHNLRTLHLRLALRRPTTAFPKLNLEKWLLVRFGINRMPNRHVVHRYMDAAAPLGVQYDGAGLDYFIPEAQRVRPADLDLPDAFLAFAIGATHATKRMPVEQLIDVCRNLSTPVVLLGGPAEAEAGARIQQAVPHGVVNACGRLSLHGSASLIREAKAVITHDTGMMHIAAAFHKPIYSIWGNTVPAFGMYPFYPDGMQRNTSLEVNGLPCRPCSKIGFQACPKRHFHCMKQQDVRILAQL